MFEAIGQRVRQPDWRLVALVVAVCAIASCAGVGLFAIADALSVAADPARAIVSASPFKLVAAAALGALVSLVGMAAVAMVAVHRWDGKIEDQDLKLNVALNNMSQGLCMFNEDSRLVLCNERYLHMYRLSPEAVKPGCTLRELIGLRKAAGTFDGDPDEYVKQRLENHRLGKSSNSTVKLSDGRIINMVNQPLASGGWVATHEDVTELHRREQELARTQRFLGLVIDNVPASISVKDARDLRYVLINRAGEDAYGVPREQMIGKTIQELFPEKPAHIIDARDRQVLESRKPQAFGEHPYDSPHKGRRIHLSRRVPVLDDHGVPQYLLLVIQDVTEQKQAEARIAYLAHHDPLTELPNRVAFNEHLMALLERAKGAREKLAILCLDIDRFKEVNDVFGHAVGDALLKIVASRLNEVAGEAFLARLGGDEFALIVGDEDLPGSAARLADRLFAAMADEIEIDGNHLRIALSVGIAMYPSDGTDITSLLANADAALYRAKAEGRGSMRFFEADMDKRLRERRALAHDLRSAIDRDELVLHYQPQAEIGGKIIGFEALARWRHPTQGIVPPGIFIPLAEESGLILKMGEHILRRACREAASWPTPLRIAVNVSPIQFRHGDLPGIVHAVLLETGLSPARLELEVTESVLVNDLPRAVSILRRLKTLGVHIAMDDFGTGYSSLQNLQSFSFDKLKIDRSFISNLETNPQSATIVRAVIGLGRGLDLPVVAEGVETKTQLEFLTSAACDEVQGFLIGRPEPIEHYAQAVGRRREQRGRLSAAG